MSPVPEWVPRDLPRGPGVYTFAAHGGTALYVGKSVNLRRRVRGWFYGGGPDDARLAEMTALARSVTVVETGSDLEARLEEAERIVAGRPRYNRVFRNRAKGWYLEIDRADPFPRVRVVAGPRRRRARYFGPLRGRAGAGELAAALERAFRLRSCAGRVVPDRAASPCLSEGLGLCTAPCIAAVGLVEYRAQVDDAARALADPGHARALRLRGTAERDAAAAALDFERAATVQRRLDRLDRVEALRPLLEEGRLDGTWLVALPHARPGRAVLVPYAAGRVLPRRALDPRAPGAAERLGAVVHEARFAALRAEPVREPAALVAARIVVDWMIGGASGGLVVDVAREDERTALARVAAWLPVPDGVRGSGGGSDPSGPCASPAPPGAPRGRSRGSSGTGGSGPHPAPR